LRDPVRALAHNRRKCLCIWLLMRHFDYNL
jgi:hypothetical protein